jgi:hypothetical protein
VQLLLSKSEMVDEYFAIGLEGAAGAGGASGTEDSEQEEVRTQFLVHFWSTLEINDPFAKRGSGQTQETHSKMARFLTGECGAEEAAGASGAVRAVLGRAAGVSGHRGD